MTICDKLDPCIKDKLSSSVKDLDQREAIMGACSNSISEYDFGRYIYKICQKSKKSDSKFFSFNLSV